MMERLKTVWRGKTRDQQVFWLAMAAALAATILLL